MGGVGRVRADFRQIDVDEVRLAGGAKALYVWLTEPKSTVSVKVDGSVGDIAVHRPQEVPVRVRVSGAVAAAEIDGRRFGAVSGGAEMIAGTWPDSTAGYDVEVHGNLSRLWVDAVVAEPSVSSASDDAHVRLPPWLGIANRLIIGLQRLGLSIGTMHTLTVAGRRTGLPRTTPVSPFTVDGQRYLVSIPGTEWVKNVEQDGFRHPAHGRIRVGPKGDRVRFAIELDHRSRVASRGRRLSRGSWSDDEEPRKLREQPINERINGSGRIGRHAWQDTGLPPPVLPFQRTASSCSDASKGPVRRDLAQAGSHDED